MRYFGLPWSRDPRERIVRSRIPQFRGGAVYAIPGAGARVRSEWAALTPRVPRGRISTPVLTRAAESGTRPHYWHVRVRYRGAALRCTPTVIVRGQRERIPSC